MNANAENPSSTTTPTLFGPQDWRPSWRRSRQQAMALAARIDLILASPRQLTKIDYVDIDETCEELRHLVSLETAGVLS